MRKLLIGSLLLAVLHPAAASAESCLEELAPPVNQSVMAYFTTMDTRGVTSYATAELLYMRGNNGFGIPRPGRWYGAPRRPIQQLFSDRFVPGQAQPFAIGRADRIEVNITHEESPLIVLNLLSRGYVRQTFIGSCSANGIIHGTSGTVDVLIQLVRFPAPG